MDERSPRRIRDSRGQILACIHCRRKKLRCDRSLPCSNCKRSRRDVCSYTADHSKAESTNAGDDKKQTTEPAAVGESAVRRTDRVQTQVNQQNVPRNAVWCASAVAKILVTTPPKTGAAAEDPSFGRLAPASRDLESTAAQEIRAADVLSTPLTMALETMTSPIRCAIIDSKYTASSKWVHAVALAPHVLGWYEREIHRSSEYSEIVKACASSAEVLRTRMNPMWIPGPYGMSLPPKDTSDLLLSTYLGTFESIHRILHVPTFMHAYDQMWANLSTVSTSVIIQTQLCLAIGACAFDDTFSFRSRVSLWIQEATHWMHSSNSMATISGIQIMCLSILARQLTQIGSEDQIWISCGAAVQTAMSIGLHRDPARLPSMPAGEAEIRRRLWTTILELTIDCSLEAGVPPVMSDDDFDCGLPSGLDDSDLDLGSASDHAPEKHHVPKTSTLQTLLGHSIPIRLSIARFVNGLKPHSYQEVLRLDGEYRAAHRKLAAHVKSTRHALSPFQLQYCELAMARSLFALHIPYMCIAKRDPAYHYSRNTCADAAVRLLQHSLPASLIQEPVLVTMREAVGITAPCEEYGHAVLCGFGPFRSIHFQAAMALAAELAVSTETRYDTPGPQAHDLRGLEMLLLLRSCVAWSRHRIWTGHENFKDYIFLAALLASLEAATEGVSAQQAMEREGKQAWQEAGAMLSQMVEQSLTRSDHGTEGEATWSDVHALGDEAFADLYWHSFTSMP